MRKPLLLFRVLSAAAVAAGATLALSAPAGAVSTRAQDQAAAQNAAGGQVTEFADQYNQRYAGQEPLEGATLPNVKLFDAEGNSFELTSTHGKYTVLVFGCLT